jgi:hypothetical protein
MIQLKIGSGCTDNGWKNKNKIREINSMPAKI